MSSRIIPREEAQRARKLDLGDIAAGGSRIDARRAGGEQEAPAADLERLREQAYREGVEAGRREAGAQLQQRDELRALIQGINELLENVEQRLATEVLSISLELAKLIVRAGVRVKPELVLSVVQDAIASLPGAGEPVTLLLNPADAALLRELARGDAALSALPWKILEDPHIERGGCKLETPSTEVDGTLETRWRRVIANLGRDDAWIDITT
ncbi:MAG TPA: FliH/SctL family protein [Burkholderiales bacterium]